MHLLLTMFFAALWQRIQATPATPCEPSQYLCSGDCPPVPAGMETPTSEALCSKDPDSDTCLCWLHNPSYRLHTLFQCETRTNNSNSKISCTPPSHCFLPDPQVSCLIVLHCPCLLFDQSPTHSHKQRPQGDATWKRVKAIVHTMRRGGDSDNGDGRSIEKVHSDVREFSMKHLLFLLGFVIAPLFCWCLLNFFHEGKCRKKLLHHPEAQPIPTSRSATIDDMNNEEAVDIHPSPTRPLSVQSHPSLSLQMPTAPAEEDTSADVHQTATLKCESPPPYCDSPDRACVLECGPPPSYEDAVRGTDVNVQQLWQTVFILEPGEGENS